MSEPRGARLVGITLLAITVAVATGKQVQSAAFPMAVQSRDKEGKIIKQMITLEPSRTAVVVIDMWDRHWCTTFTARVGHLIPRMNQTLEAARKLGIQVVFAPSDVVQFYQDYPQRRAMQAVPAHPEPKTLGWSVPAPPGPTDFCECGPAKPCRPRACWTRQHPDLKIARDDLIADCNNGRELLNLCAYRKYHTLLYAGVASNMCLQYRSMGLRNMKNHGLQVLVVADLVEAISSNGLDAQGKKDLNFTPAGGSARVQQHLERDLAPTLESRQLLAAARMNRHFRDSRPHVVLIAAEQEYQSNQTLPAFVRQFLEKDYRCTCLEATGPEGSGRDFIPGLEALYDADLLVLSMRRRSLPVIQMDLLERYIRAGKPLVALRPSIVAFQTGKDPQLGHVVWDRFDQEVLGCNYRGYNAKARASGCDVWIVPRAINHSILQGVKPKFHSPCWIYRQRPLAPNSQVLLEGRWSNADPVEPVAWTNSYAGGRVFYTSLGHPGDFQGDAFPRLLRNAIDWALPDHKGPLP